MKRSTRIALNTFGPPLVASLILLTMSVVSAISSPRSGEFASVAKLIPLVLFFAYLLATIPSVIHALIMEWLYQRYPAHTWKACLASGGSGVLAGVFIDIFFLASSQLTQADAWLLIYPVFGFIVGLLIGFTVKLLTEKSKAATTERSLRGCE